MGGRGASAGSGGSSAGGGGGIAAPSGEDRGALSAPGAPSLTGSEKQVAWAQNLRQSFMDYYGKSRPDYVKKEVLAHPDAKYWIDNRYGLGVTNADQKAIQKLWYNK